MTLTLSSEHWLQEPLSLSTWQPSPLSAPPLNTEMKFIKKNRFCFFYVLPHLCTEHMQLIFNHCLSPLLITMAHVLDHPDILHQCLFKLTKSDLPNLLMSSILHDPHILDHLLLPVAPNQLQKACKVLNPQAETHHPSLNAA